MRYPKLMHYHGNGFIVLFTSRNTGTVVNTGPANKWCIGHHSTGWWNADDSTVWQDYTGTIELGNLPCE